MTKIQLQQEILETFGAPTVRVELDVTHLETAYGKAVDWFMARMGLRGNKMKMMTVNQGVSFSDIDSTYGVYKIIDVIQGLDPSVAEAYGEGFYGMFPYGFPIMGGAYKMFGGKSEYSSFVQLLQSLNQRRKLFGTDPDWYEVRSIDGNHQLFIDGRRNVSLMCMIIYKAACTRENFPMDVLRGQEWEFFKRYAINEARYILGKIRSKYKDLPAAGGTVSLDGDTLLDEWKTEKEYLDEKIFKIQGTYGIVVG